MCSCLNPLIATYFLRKATRSKRGLLDRCFRSCLSGQGAEGIVRWFRGDGHGVGRLTVNFPHHMSIRKLRINLTSWSACRSTDTTHPTTLHQRTTSLSIIQSPSLSVNHLQHRWPAPVTVLSHSGLVGRSSISARGSSRLLPFLGNARFNNRLKISQFAEARIRAITPLR